jgi:hypothetical protein
MAIALALDYVERNDNKIITLSDISTGWSDPAGVDIYDTTLTVQIDITLSDNTTTSYSAIDLVAKNTITAATTQAELVYVLDTSELIVTGVPLGTADDVFPDGIYTFTYVYDVGEAGVQILEESVLMEGNVRNAVYNAMRTIPTLYMCNDCKSKQIMDAIFAYGYLNSIRAGGYVAKTEELINQLYVLERLLNYGSSYTW